MDSLTPEQKEYLKDVFHLLDKNGNEKIESKELGDGLRAMGMNPSHKDVQDLIQSFDLSGDGSLDFDEFVNAFVEFSGQTSTKEDELELLFNSLDINRDRKISRDELRQFLCSGGEPFNEDEIDKVFNEFDSNEDGFISLQELASALTGK